MTIVHIALERMVQSFAIAKNVGRGIGAMRSPKKVGQVTGRGIGATKRPIKVGQEIDATITISFLQGLGNSILFRE